jgi:hypothetical protein
VHRQAFIFCKIRTGLGEKPTRPIPKAKIIANNKLLFISLLSAEQIKKLIILT